MTHIKSAAARQAILDMPACEGLPFNKIFPNASPEALDLLEKMLKFDPNERLSASEALRHPYFKEYHDYVDEDFPDITKILDQA